MGEHGQPPVPSEAIAAAARALADGGVVCVPTETTYGLAADIESESGLARLLELKGRDPAKSPIALMAAHADQARALAETWPPLAARLADEHWPGPLTLVVPARHGLASCLVGPGGGVGVRVPGHHWPRALAGALGRPITATSANPHGEPAAATCAAAQAYFGDGVSVYLDAGTTRAGHASTIVAIDRDGQARLLRQGVLSLPELASRATKAAGQAGETGETGDK